jgi:glycosyltransferase involved in cell wall biosynthesis
MTEPTIRETAVAPSGKLALFLPDLGSGGAERISVHLANGLARRGHEVDMVLIQAEGQFLADLQPGVRVVNLGGGRVMGAVPRLAAYLRSARPAALISALDYVNVGAILARGLSRTKIPVVAAVHVTRSMDEAAKRGGREALLRIAIRWCYRRADAIVCVSQGVADDLIRVTGVPREKVRVVYNPVIGPQILERAGEPVSHPWFAAGEPGVILAVGNLTPPKDYATLLRAFAMVRQTHSVRLMILGEGPLRAPLEGLVGELGLRPWVAMPGFSGNPYACMARAALYVLSSAWEALPTVLIEAMAVGAKVVATDCRNGPREILQGGRYGRLVPVGDAAALAGAISAALSEPKPAIPAEVLRPYGLDFAVDRYRELIAEVTGA